MTSSFTTRLHELWLRTTRLDLVGLAILLVYAALWVLRLFVPGVPQSSFFTFLALLVLCYFMVRGILWARLTLLWSLRNRLMIAYVFIAVVPVLLLLTMAGLTVYVLYWQLGSYVLHTEMQERMTRVSDVAATMATSYAIEEASGHHVGALAIPESTVPIRPSTVAELPGLKVELDKGRELLQAPDGTMSNRFSGLVLNGDTLTLLAAAVRPIPSGQVFVSASVPVTPELMETLAPELGPLRFDVLRPVGAGANPATEVFFQQQEYVPVQQIETSQRTTPRGANVFDWLFNGITTLDVTDQDRKTTGGAPARVFVSFSTRPSLLNQRLFSPLGNLGTIVTALFVIGAVFLLIELGSLVTGVILTRTITSSVDDLYHATQHVQAGDLTFRTRVKQHDQLGALAESFNSMMQSVSTLIEEQRIRHRLENELSIAHEVQEQLFPRSLPKLPGVELEAICRPARMVSGDYYDFIRIGPTRLAIALADISGKGISAALLMANVQAALRSDVLRHRDGAPGTNPTQIHTDEIISHLNRHLFRNTSDERYATCFFAVYDTETRCLTYTNAGHLPPLYISGGRIQKLTVGGMVVGLFPDVPFEQGAIAIDPGGLLIAYSDGLMESENVYGEELGPERLAEVALRHAGESPHIIAEALMRAAEEWSSSPEQADDMTVIVARLSTAAQAVRV